MMPCQMAFLGDTQIENPGDPQYYPKASSGLVPYNNTQPELNIFKESKYSDIANKVESFMLIDRLSLS